MQIIKQNMLFTGVDGNIKITLSSNDDVYGQQQGIDRLTNSTANSLINPVIDSESRRYPFKTDASVVYMSFKFKNNEATFLEDGAGFTSGEVALGKQNVLNSFFVLDFYDTYDPNTQTKIFSTYMTKIGLTPDYSMGDGQINQFHYLPIPQWYIDSQTGSTINGYAKFSFYNAKYGKTSLFYNYTLSNTEWATTPRKMYFDVAINLYDVSWKFPNNVDARELMNSIAYTNKISNTVDKIDDIKQVYPSGGTTFNYSGADYI